MYMKSVGTILTIHEKLLKKFISIISCDDTIHCMLLAGSLARGEGDKYSDIDLTLIAESGKLLEMQSRLPDLTRKCSTRLLGGFLPDTNTYAVLYEIDGLLIKVDFDCFDKFELSLKIKKSNYLSEYFSDSRILFSRSKEIEYEIKSIKRGIFRGDNDETSSFLLSAWTVVRMLNRGEVLEAWDVLNHMRDPYVTRLLCCRYSIGFRNYRRMETLLPYSALKQLKRTFARPQARDIPDALRELIKLYIRLREDAGEPLTKDESMVSDCIIKRLI